MGFRGLGLFSACCSVLLVCVFEWVGRSQQGPASVLASSEEKERRFFDGKGGCLFVRVCERQRAVGLFLGHTAVWPMIWLSGEPKNGVV